MKAKDINWNRYYNSIRDVCPWSNYAFNEGKLFHTQFRSYVKVIENELMMTPMKLWTISYLDCPYSADELKEWCNKRNKQQTIIEYHSTITPVPLLIQHRSDILDMARKGVFDKGVRSNSNPDFMIDKYEQTGLHSTGGKGAKSCNKRYTKQYGIKLGEKK